MSFNKLISLSSLLLFTISINTLAADSFTPYTKSNVPQTVTDLWKDYDPRKESLDVKIIKEWKIEGVVTRYITFKVGTFKGVPARIAAYYSFPENGLKNPAFVWSHGGGQRADRNRGIYFAKQGYATVDINWLGRPLENDIAENTDWGKVDPTQGKKFYSKALRKSWKTNFQPDEHTIDPVISPRNSNWFLLAVAGKRAITFLEEQAEVDKEKLGFAGYSMGGMITSFNAIDKRLKAVVPFVGGTGFKHEDMPGIERSSQAAHYHGYLDLYKKTMDKSSYWPLVDCPIMFITSSNDFHSKFERIYKSLHLVKHKNWRVSSNIHANHGPDHEQWIMLNKWFDHYLKGTGAALPQTPASTFKINAEHALLNVTPDDIKNVINTEIYYSYDPNAVTRFWNKAKAVQNGNSWSAKIALKKNLPLYTFAICRYKDSKTRKVQRGETNTFTLNSLEHIHMPSDFDIAALDKIKSDNKIFDDFSNGLQDWQIRKYHGLSTYKFQNPELKIKDSQKLKITLNSKSKDLYFIASIDGKFLRPQKSSGTFTAIKKVSKGGEQVLTLSLNDFKSKDGKKASWAKIATFRLQLKETDAKMNMNLKEEEWLTYLKKIEIID